MESPMTLQKLHDEVESLLKNGVSPNANVFINAGTSLNWTINCTMVFAGWKGCQDIGQNDKRVVFIG